MECRYSIYVYPGSHVKLTFDHYSTEHGYDYISVFDGAEIFSGSTEIARFSGNGASRTFYSGENGLSVLFTSDGLKSTYAGFSATFEEIGSMKQIPKKQDICGSVVYDGSNMGSFHSPNYPSNYPNNANCQWIIRPPSSQLQIRLTFDSNSRTQAGRDQVKVSEYGGNTYYYSGQGNASWPTLISSARKLVITFQSDNETIMRGFSANVEFLVPTPTPDCSCGQTVHYINTQTGNQTLTSPNWPNQYCNDLDCIWYLKVLDGSTIQLSFDFFETEYYYNYYDEYYDSLSLYDRLGIDSSDLLGRCSGDGCDSVRSSGSWLTLRFTTDNIGRRRGFNATWGPV